MSWYWRDGTLAYTFREPGWEEKARLVEERLRDISYKRVAFDVLADGKVVSTVWIGLELEPRRKGEAPLIFETMVFPSESNFRDLDCERYATEEQAKAGHEEMVERWRDKLVVVK